MAAACCRPSQGGAGPGEVLGEYLAEGAIAPLVMIRRGALQVRALPADPDQLYDLAADPDERVNLRFPSGVCAASSPSFAPRWRGAGRSPRSIRQCSRASSRRHFVYAALRQGRYSPWDYQPLRDASRLYIRNDQELNDLEAMARFPPRG